MTYKPHELCLAFPEMPSDQFARLLASIRDHGLLHPIMLFEGAILDGRHRYKACEELDIEPRFEQYTGNDAAAFVLAENMARRHMTQSQLAHSAAGMKDYYERKARERQEATQINGGKPPVGAERRQPSDDAGRTADKLAEVSGVGARTINRAIKVREHGTVELNAAVASGDIALTQAEKIASLNENVQKKIVDANPRERKAKIREAFNRSVSCRKRESGLIGLPAQPSTPFVRKLLSGLESLATICAESGVKNAQGIAQKFTAEMDWENPALIAQFERGERIVAAFSIIRDSNPAREAKAA